MLNVCLPWKVDVHFVAGNANGRTVAPLFFEGDGTRLGCVLSGLATKEPPGRHGAFCTRRCCQDRILGLVFLSSKPPGPASDPFGFFFHSMFTVRVPAGNPRRC